MSQTPDWIFLLWGQSNMAGRGEVLPEDRTVVPGIQAWDDISETWVDAVDPIFNDTTNPGMAGTGLARPFAEIILKQFPKKRIGLIPTAVGGSPLEQWDPHAGAKGFLFKRGIAQAERATRQGGLIKGILWHQGEADSINEERSQSYAERFKETVREARALLNQDHLPLIAGELGRFLKDRPSTPFYNTVNEQLQSVVHQEKALAWVSSEGCQDKGDILHFNREAVKLLGTRYAEAILEFL